MSSPDKPTVVGIAGGTASGKSTAARELARRLGDRCVWLTHDRYYRTIPDSHRDDPASYNFDHPNALETSLFVDHLRELRRGRTVRVPDYDFATHVRRPEAAWTEIHPRPFVIVEGILVLADMDLRSAMDHRVFVHTPDDIRLMRRIRRDLTERGRQVDEILEQYQRSVRPMHEAFVAPSQAWADLVLDGTNTVDSMVASVLDLIRHGG